MTIQQDDFDEDNAQEVTEILRIVDGKTFRKGLSIMMTAVEMTLDIIPDAEIRRETAGYICTRLTDLYKETIQ